MMRKPDRDTTKNSNRSISLLNTDAGVPTKCQKIKLNNTLRRLYTVMWFNSHKLTNVTYHIKKLKNKSYMIITIGIEKGFDKI